MKQIDIKADKLRLIEYLLKIQDEVVIQRIKTLVEDVIEKRREEQMQPMSLDEFYAKIDESEKAYERGEFTTQDELREEINTWRKT